MEQAEKVARIERFVRAVDKERDAAKTLAIRITTALVKRVVSGAKVTRKDALRLYAPTMKRVITNAFDKGRKLK